MQRLKLLLVPFQQGMHFFGERVGAVVNTTLLGIVYGIGIGIPSVLARLFRKQFLETKLDRGAVSYWRPISQGDKSIRRYLRQF